VPIDCESLGLRIVPAPVGTTEQPHHRPESSRSSDGPHGPHPPLIDVVFVHGLGGSRGTWTHPKSGFWLQEGNYLENVRISTFGYDANWDPTKRGNALGTADFARKLLTALDLHYTAFGNVCSLRSHLLIFRLLQSLWRILVVKKVISGRIHVYCRPSLRLMTIRCTHRSSEM
jgi:hypothetical protein